MRKAFFCSLFILVAVSVHSQIPHIAYGFTFYNDSTTPLNNLGFQIWTDEPFTMGPFYYNYQGHEDTAVNSTYYAQNGGFVIQLSVFSRHYTGQEFHIIFIDNDTEETCYLSFLRGSGSWTEISSLVIFPYPPSGALIPPENVVFQMEADSLVLSWDTVETAAGYIIYRAEDPFGTYELIGETTETHYPVAEVDTTKKWFYYVTSVTD